MFMAAALVSPFLPGKISYGAVCMCEEWLMVIFLLTPPGKHMKKKKNPF